MVKPKQMKMRIKSLCADIKSRLSRSVYKLLTVRTRRYYEEVRRIRAQEGTHFLKLNAAFAGAVWLGKKPFEVRFNDRGYQPGDTVRFIVVDDSGTELDHPLNHYDFEITYVLSGWGLKEGYVAFAMRRKKP